jgi:hypothetical protein
MVACMSVARIGPLRVRTIDGGVQVECDVSPRPGRRWREAFAVGEDVAFGHFNSVRVSGSKLIAESFDGSDIEDLAEARDRRIEHANLRASASPSPRGPREPAELLNSQAIKAEGKRRIRRRWWRS